MREYLVIYEPGEVGWSAYLPGCVSTGADCAGAEEGIREAIGLHLEGVRAEGLHVPPPRSTASVTAT